MGFDPRRWSGTSGDSQRVTANLDVLLAENAALRRELQSLRRRLDLLEQRQAAAQSRHAQTSRTKEDPAASEPRITTDHVRRWGDALAAQAGWKDLRLGDLEHGLRGLLDELNRRSFNPTLTLEQRLDRLAPGLGGDLQRALPASFTKRHCAVRAAFALYGISALEWLDDAPSRVVSDLRHELQRLERRQAHRQPGKQRTTGRRTRSDQRKTDRTETTGSQEQRHSHDRHQQQARSQSRGSAPFDADPQRVNAYQVLGLQWGASLASIKQAHRRLVKQHHPDMGGRAEDFHRINTAYQLLVA